MLALNLGARFIRLSVQPRCRRHGIGRELLDAVCSVLRAASCVTVDRPQLQAPRAAAKV